MWRKTPGLSLVTFLSLALAIAANVTMFALAGSFLFTSLPYEDQKELVLIETDERDALTDDYRDEVSAPDFLELQGQLSSISGLCAFDDEPYVLTGLEQPQEVLVTTVTPDLFGVLGVEPLFGRNFGPADGSVENRQILLLDYSFWQSHFAGSRDVLGRTLTLNGIAHSVVGVLPEEFNLLQGNVAAYRPDDLRDRIDRGYRDLLVFGRLAPGNTMEQARAEMSVIADQIAADHPALFRNLTLTVAPLSTRFPGRTDRLLITITIVVTILGLFIACANIANLLLSKAGTRMKEVAIRMTLGAERGRLLRQFLSESVLMGLGAGLAGTLLAVVAVYIFRTAFPADIPRTLLPDIDGGVLLLTLLLSIATGILFGLAPALFATVKDLRGALSDGGRSGTAGRKWKRLRHAFVIGEVAVALGILTGAGLLAGIFNHVLHPEPGFRSEGLVAVSLTLSDYLYPDQADLLGFQRELIPALKAIPGVDGVALMNRLPRARGWSSAAFTPAGEVYDDPDERPETGWLAVSEDYFTTLEVQVLSGRFLDDRDKRETRPVAVVNRSFVETFCTDREPVGMRLELLGEMREIVGVVGNVCQERIPEGFDIETMVYLPLEQQLLRYPTVALRADAEQAGLAAAIRETIWSVNPEQPIGALQTYDEAYRASLGGASVFGDFLVALCTMAMFLAAMGIFGIISHTVVRRTREIGIRLSVGARGGQVVGLITRQGIRLTAIGFVLGAPLAYLMTQFVRGIFQVSAGESLPLSGYSTIAILAVVALLASWLPARRAAKVDPVTALKAE